MDGVNAVDHVSVSRVSGLSDAAMPASHERRPTTPSPRTSPPAPEPREHGASGEHGASLPLVLMASLGAHVLFGVALTALPVAAGLSSRAPQTIEFEVSALPAPPPVVPPAPEPAPIPELEPAGARDPEPVRAPRPERVAAAPTPAPPPPAAVAAPPPPSSSPPAPSSAPPSLDEVFGEPPPPLPSLTAEGGSGAFTVAAGSPEGAAGGVPGGRGRATIGATRGGTGAADGIGQGAAGPSADEIRRARRAYAERVRELLGRLARYPVPARRGGLEGRVVVALRIANDGRLLGARVSTSCGYAMLDEAALAAANDLRQVPAPPELCSWDDGDELRVPIVFELTN